MAVTYEVWLSDPMGNRIQLLSGYNTLEWVRTVNAVGTFWITFGASGNDPFAFDHQRLYRKERRVEIIRYTDDGPPKLIMVGFLRKRARWMQGNQRFVGIGGVDQMAILSRRIVLGSPSQVKKTGFVDDVMFQYVSLNLGFQASAERDVTEYGFTLIGAASQGPSVSKSAGRANLLKTLQELSAYSARTGPRILFDVVAYTPTRLVFQAFAHQRGLDRVNVAVPLVFSVENGNLVNPYVIEDASDEYTDVWVGGRGKLTKRQMGNENDPALEALGPYGKIERFFNVNGLVKDQLNQQELADQASAHLQAGRELSVFRGRLIETESCQFGKDWDFGDRVIASYDGEEFEGEKASVSAIFAHGDETIEGIFQNVTGQ